jgi:hypothetical protein
MTTNLKHAFQFKANQDLVKLFDGVNKFSNLIKNIEKLSIKNPDKYNINEYKGDAFEFFVEMFLNAFQFDNRVMVSNYEPNKGIDNGVDGIGVNYFGDKCAIQVKYRSNSETLLSTNQDHLANLIVDAQMRHDITLEKDLKKPKKHFIFTTAKGLHYYTDSSMFEGSVKCFGIEDFKSMLDNNVNFWNWCRETAKSLTKNKK